MFPLKEKLLRCRINDKNFIMTRVDICVSFTCSNAVATALMPSLCGIFVYKERTSIVTKIDSAGNSVILFNLLMKSVVSVI